jgi:hypothetical protein
MTPSTYTKGPKNRRIERSSENFAVEIFRIVGGLEGVADSANRAVAPNSALPLSRVWQRQP